MLCAVYGVMIFANTLTGLWVESLFPYLFAFPILICAIKQTPQVSLCALVAMFILTLMLGSLTTWLIAGSMLAAGWVFGWGIHQRISLVWTAVFCFGVMTLLNYLEVSVLLLFISISLLTIPLNKAVNTDHPSAIPFLENKIRLSKWSRHSMTNCTRLTKKHLKLEFARQTVLHCQFLFFALFGKACLPDNCLIAQNEYYVATYGVKLDLA